MAGLRREEIDLLQWSAFKWDQKLLSIQRTRYFQPKSNHSIGDVDLDCEFVTLFRGWRAQARSDEDFVIVSEVKPQPGATYFHYRCNASMDKLTDWLRGKGVSGKSPLHTLRKEYGSQINARHGIYEASRALRHADINITTQHYVRNTKRIAPELGHLLITAPENIVDLAKVSRKQSNAPINPRMWKKQKPATSSTGS
jgi:integrase